ncbi:heterokaryon incompatibility protein-domain-containing protein [Podospora didyma]|uniref:Heterokaryon incompatibility protein-domain-containing protein n=1 Tax=Podospora didyma TaxID=330526 RepID=A0AAE0P8C2_9PEZI|nr:heterokaryon incompatibility protein-domain-containing protein [Podospora didyma]
MEDEKPRFHCPENSAFYKGGHYLPLDPDGKEIRLLKALPPDDADPDGPLRFSLSQQVPLSDTELIPLLPCKPFIAMSYCAGDPNKTIPVFIDGEVFNVFESLGRALRALLLSLGRNKESTSQLEDTLYIWADQICINQSDGTEKSSQVLMMCQIYEHCAWAYSWLGTDPHVSKGLLGSRMLDLVQQKIDSYYEDKGEPVNNARNSDISVTWSTLALQQLADMGADWSAIETYLKNAYWFRGWICQEVTVPPDITFNTDTRETDRASMRRSLRLLETIRLAIRWNFDIIDPSSNKTGFRELVAKPFSKQDLADLTPLVQGLRWLYEMDIGPLKFILEDSEGWKDSKGYSLENLLLVARHSEVTDPLDRVYAYLGLAHPGYDITPDYGPSQTTAGVYTEATVAYIKRHKGLNILSFAEDRTEILGPELPSWVCDWSIKMQPLSLWHRTHADPKAGPNASRKMPYHTIDLLPGPNGEPDRVLRVPVIPIDIIADPATSVGGTVSSYTSWEACVASWLVVAGLRTDVGNCETNDVFYEYGGERDYLTLAMAFWSTVYRGIADVDMIRKMWDSLSSMDDPDDPDPDSGEEEKEEAEVEAEEDIYSGPAEEGDAAAGAAKALKALSLDHDQDDKEKKKDDVKRGDDGGNKTDDDGGNLVEEDGTGDGNDRSDDSDEKTLVDDQKKKDKDNRHPPSGSGLAKHHLAISTFMDMGYLQRGNWKFLRTESGCFALTRAASVQDGDIIMVLIGADTPFLMRRHLDGYKLVGEVYVQGIMRGESLDDVEVTTDGGLVLDYIKIY